MSIITTLSPLGGTQQGTAAWLMMETPDTPMHVGVLAILRKPRNAGKDYLDQLAASMLDGAEPVAPWNCILAGQGRRCLTPRLVEADEVDTGYHLRHSALPAPGGEKELGGMVSRLHSNALDMKRPLWELHLIEGLQHNRFACYLKIHHALVADVNAIPLMIANLTTNPRTRNLAPPWAQPIVGREQADTTDSTINELLTYLCGSSLRRFFKEYNALPDDPLVGIMPISLQERSEQIPGNAIAGIRVALGTHIGNPLERLKAIKQSIAQLMQYSALSIDCVSYAGTLNIGFTGARETLPHLQRLAVYLGKALSDLEEIVAGGDTAT